MPIVSNLNKNTTSSQPSMSELLKKSIQKASYEDRLKVGLDECVEHLYSCDPYKVLAVALTDSSNDIITQTILETFCYENKIPFLKTDSKILRRILKPVQMGNFDHSQSGSCGNDPCCVLILRPVNIATYQEELALLNLIRESELKNETLVILNSYNSREAVTPNSPNMPEPKWNDLT